MAYTYNAKLSAEKLRSLIRERKLTQEKLAERLGCSDRQIRAWISKDTNARVSSVYCIAKVLGVQISELLEVSSETE